MKKGQAPTFGGPVKERKIFTGHRKKNERSFNREDGWSAVVMCRKVRGQGQSQGSSEGATAQSPWHLGGAVVSLPIGTPRAHGRPQGTIAGAACVGVIRRGRSEGPKSKALN